MGMRSHRRYLKIRGSGENHPASEERICLAKRRMRQLEKEKVITL